MQTERVTHDRPLGQFFYLQKFLFQSGKKLRKLAILESGMLTTNVSAF